MLKPSRQLLPSHSRSSAAYNGKEPKSLSPESKSTGFQPPAAVEPGCDPIPAVKSTANFFGANRILAKRVGQELSDCSWVGIPFMGGGSEIPFIRARSIVCNDLHKHVVNLARTMADGNLGPRLYRRLRRQIFAPDALTEAQKTCQRFAQVAQSEDHGKLFFAGVEPLGILGLYPHDIRAEVVEMILKRIGANGKGK